MNYPVDPKGIGRRSNGIPDRIGLSNERFGKSQHDQSIRPCVFGPCWHTTMIEGLSYSGSAGDGDIVWADEDDHDKVFDINLRDGSLKYVQPVIQSISYTVAPGGPSPLITQGILAYFIMYYKDGSEINFNAVVATGNLFFEATAPGFNLVHQPLIDYGTQAWETPGQEAPTLYPSGFAIRSISNAASSVDIDISQLFIASLNQ